MDKIWAPWRIKYIKRIRRKGCVFCCVSKAKDNRKKYVLLRGKYAFIIMNIYPYNNGHLMVAPFRHKPSLRKLNKHELDELITFTKKAQDLIDRALKPDGYNIGINEGSISGAGIARHVHIHIVPRWKGDTNFMPIIANVKTISQSLDELFLKLKRLIK